MKRRLCFGKTEQKECPPEHYVGIIMSVHQHGLEHQIQFYKWIRNSSKFVKESEKEFDVVGEDIMVKLPKPVELSSSATTQGQLW